MITRERLAELDDKLNELARDVSDGKIDVRASLELAVCLVFVAVSRSAQENNDALFETISARIDGLRKNGNDTADYYDCGRDPENLRYKLAWSGGSLVEVPAAYSSQTCSACGRVDSRSRRAERFACASCGYTDHADLNAAKVLKQRFETPGNPWCLPVEGEGSPRSRKVSKKLRVPRRCSQVSSSGELR